MTSKHDDYLEENSASSETGDSRRAAIKKIVIGAGVATGAATVPSKWTQPLMNKVLIPAHAQTSGPTEFSGSFTIEFQRGKFGVASPIDVTTTMTYTTPPDITTTPAITTTMIYTTPPPPMEQKLTGEMCVKLSDDGTKFDATLKVMATGVTMKSGFSTSGSLFPPTAFFTISGGAVGSLVTLGLAGGCYFPVPLKVKVAPIVAAKAEVEITGPGLYASGNLGVGSKCPIVESCPPV